MAELLDPTIENSSDIGSTRRFRRSGVTGEKPQIFVIDSTTGGKAAELVERNTNRRLANAYANVAREYYARQYRRAEAAGESMLQAAYKTHLTRIDEAAYAINTLPTPGDAGQAASQDRYNADLARTYNEHASGQNADDPAFDTDSTYLLAAMLPFPPGDLLPPDDMHKEEL